MAGAIIIKNASLFTGGEVLEKGYVIVRSGVIERLGTGEVREEAGDVIDAGGRLVTPGFTIGHTHIYSALARGIVLGSEPAKNFVEILERLWWLLDEKLTLEQVELSALLYGADCLRSGVTTVFDHHASYGAIRGSLSVIAEALLKTGLRACLCFEVSDRAGARASAEAVEENSDFIRRAAGGAMPLLRAMFGLHASFTLSDETLARCAAAADPDETGFHIHAAEDRADQEITLEKYGTRVVQRLHGAGILGKRSLCSHGIWLDDAERALLARAGTRVAYNPQSNLNNAVGALDLGAMRRGGVDVILGTDGFTANILREALVGQVLQNHLASDPGAGWGLVPDLVLGANNDLMKDFFGFDNRLMKPGGRCDVVLWNYNPPTPLTGDNFWGHAVFGLLDSRADSVIVDGRLVLRNGTCTGYDEAEVMAECRAAAAALWKAMSGR